MSRLTHFSPKRSSDRSPKPDSDAWLGQSQHLEEPSVLGNLFIVSSLISSLSLIVGLLCLLASRPSLPFSQDSYLPTEGKSPTVLDLDLKT